MPFVVTCTSKSIPPGGTVILGSTCYTVQDDRTLSPAPSDADARVAQANSVDFSVAEKPSSKPAPKEAPAAKPEPKGEPAPKATKKKTRKKKAS